MGSSNASTPAADNITLQDGQKIAYIDRGQGTPLLLMHGYTGTARTHLGSLLEPLSRHHRVIAPDLRGYGESQPRARRFPTDFYQRDADDMEQLLSALEAEPAVVLGFSDGAESALLLAATHPGRVRAVVAWGVCGIISTEQIEAVRRWLPVETWNTDRQAWRQEIIAQHGEAQFKPMIEGWVQAAEEIYAAGGNICLRQADRIRCPVLLINGSDEIGNPAAAVQKLATRIPGAQLVFVNGSAHAVHEDQFVRFMDLLSEFLTEVTRCA